MQIFNYDATVLDHKKKLSDIHYINTGIDASKINSEKDLSYEAFSEFIQNYDHNFFNNKGNRSVICLYSKTGTGKTLLCKKLISDINQNTDEIHTRMISTSELTSNQELNLLIEMAYSENIIEQIIERLDPALVNSIKENLGTEVSVIKLNFFIRKVEEFLKEFIKSRKDPSYHHGLFEMYEEISKEEALKIQTEIFLDFKIKGLLKRTQINQNVILDIVKSEISTALSKKCEYVVITLDDAVVGFDNNNAFQNKTLMNLKDIGGRVIPKDLKGFLFIFGITSYPDISTVQDRIRLLKLDVSWINNKLKIINYLRNKINNIIIIDEGCERCAHLKNCQKNFSQILFNENFLIKWIEEEFLAKIKEEKRTPREINKSFGTLLYNFLNDVLIIDDLNCEFSETSLINAQLDISEKKEILNFLNLIYWYGEKCAIDEYKMSCDLIWFLKSDNIDLMELFKKGIIYTKDNYIYTSIKTPVVSFHLENKYILNQKIEIKPHFRPDINEIIDKKIDIFIKNQVDESFEKIEKIDDKFSIDLNQKGEYLIKLIANFKLNQEEIQFEHQESTYIEDFPLIITNPINKLKYLPDSVEKVIIKSLDPNVKNFTLICSDPKENMTKKDFSMREGEDQLEIQWGNFYNKIEESGKYQISIEYNINKTGPITEFYISKYPISIKHTVDNERKEISIEFHILEDLDINEDEFENCFEIKIEKKETLGK